MNKLFNSPNKLLKFVLLFSATVLVLGIIFVAFFGFNKSYEFGGYYEITLDYQDIDKTAQYKETIKETLESHNYTIYYEQVGDKSYATSLVIRYQSDAKANAEQIQDELKGKLNITDKTQTLTITTLSKSYLSNQIFKLLIPAGITIVALFLYGLVRKNLIFGLALDIAFAGSLLLGLSLYAITRVQLSVATLGLLGAFSLLSVVLFTIFSTRAEILKKSVHGEKKQLVELFSEGVFGNFYVTYLPLIILSIIMIGLLFTFKSTLVNVGLAGIVCLINLVWTSVFVTGSVYYSIINSSNEKIKKIMSRNNKKSTTKKEITIEK